LHITQTDSCIVSVSYARICHLCVASNAFNFYLLCTGIVVILLIVVLVCLLQLSFRTYPKKRRYNKTHCQKKKMTTRNVAKLLANIEFATYSTHVSQRGPKNSDNGWMVKYWEENWKL